MPSHRWLITPSLTFAENLYLCDCHYARRRLTAMLSSNTSRGWLTTGGNSCYDDVHVMRIYALAVGEYDSEHCPTDK